MIGIDSSSSSSLLQQVQERQNTLLERLASGRRVNSASDDAAAQQIIDRLTTEVEGNRRSIANAFDGVSLAQVAEGGLSGISEDVNRIRELSVQAGNGLLNDSDRQAIQSEISALQDNITQTIEQTTFGGQELLTQDGNIEFQVGSQAGQRLNVGTQDVATGLDGILNVDVTQPGGAEAALEAADEAVEFVGAARSELGATQNRFESAARNLSQTAENLAAARSRQQDTDFAQTTSESAAAGIQSQAAIAVQSQANQQQGQVLALLS